MAIKLLAFYTHDQEEQLERRIEKARIASQLRSAHVARIVDIGRTDEAIPYIATELLDGHTLAVEPEDRGRIDVQQSARWMLDACEEHVTNFNCLTSYAVRLRCAAEVPLRTSRQARPSF